jgi:C1A family cysteine protease
MSKINISELVADLQKGDTNWQARETTVSQLPDPQQKALLGVVVNTEELAGIMNKKAAAAPVANYAQQVDWRNHNGNHITSVKDQGGCGSCVSFCATAVVEAMASIEHGQLLNLSEADLHFCSSHGANCGGFQMNPVSLTTRRSLKTTYGNSPLRVKWVPTGMQGL